ncbi:uncharacterized protein LOC133987661 [Scomber scombrus]|uniref:uncharacterized protein LOC133987661 n=1 Tax=Scomber scombrus TaxID=13677 RepID=UPI002DD8AD3E|nr:uncharacterized protein LOC133987661 [Scomber scombrus]
MYQEPGASHAWGTNNEEETGSAVGVVWVGPTFPSHPMAAQLLLSSIFAASVDNFHSRGPPQCSQQHIDQSCQHPRIFLHNLTLTFPGGIAAASQRSWESGTARRADYEAELNQRQSPLIVSMATHAFLLCSLALLSALSRPGLSFTDEESQPGLTYDEVPEILDRSGFCVEISMPTQMSHKDRLGQTTQPMGGPSLQAELAMSAPLTKRTLNKQQESDQPFNWHQPGMSHSKRKLLQSLMGPYGPLSVSYNGKTCILFKAKRLAIRYRNHTFIDLTERVFNPNSPVDTKGSICTKEKATLSLKFGDVEDLRGLVIRLQMSNTFYEAAGQNWFTLDSVHIHYNWTQEATFNASEVYAPATSSYHCQHVSSLHKYDTLLVPSSHTDTSANWHITFTDFQIQAFNVQSDKFASASDCATFLTPAILMGLVTSLILLLVLAYALHMVVHLKHIDRYEEHKATVYFPRSPEAELPDKNSL